MYHPEPYWNEVARQISRRKDSKIIAGDDEPYYRYKRSKFLELFRTINFTNKSVLEIGSGPGGNLKEVLLSKPSDLVGVDISDEMVRLSRAELKGLPVEIYKIDGLRLPFKNNQFDISFTSTVLQHNTDEEMLLQIVNEICRVTSHELYIFEKIEPQVKGTDLCMGRPIEYYNSIISKNGFQLKQARFLNIPVSFFVSGVVRKLFNSKKRKEGEAISSLSYFLQKISLPITAKLDNVFSTDRELAMLQFTKVK